MSAGATLPEFAFGPGVSHVPRMTFRDWQELAPGDAARRVRTLVQERLTAAAQRAAIAWLAPEPELAARFAAAGRTKPLGGVPFFAKDLYDFPGSPTRAGSTFLDLVRPTPPHGGAFARALRSAGAVCVGKTQMHEFAYGITGENPHSGDCEHPHFPGRTTGGSSSGSAVVVAADIVPFALASDTGGSVRVPAAFCGLYGFRLTPGDPWIRDAFPLAPTFDTPGWFTRDAAGLRATLEALVPPHDGPPSPLGCYLEYGTLDPEVAAVCAAAAARLAPPAPPEIREALVAGFAPALDAYNTITAQEAWQVHRSWAVSYREHYDPGVWQRLNRAHAITPAQSDAADAALQSVRAVWKHFFATRDFLVLPGAPLAAPTKAECTLETRNRLLTLTAPVSLGGLPTLTIPLPLRSGLTTGLQIVARDPGSPVFAWALDRLSGATEA